jgi:hypothetical protein
MSSHSRIIAIALCASSLYANSPSEPKTQHSQTFASEQTLAGDMTAKHGNGFLENGRPDPSARLKVFLQLWVKVQGGWADNAERVKSFGYE